MATEIVEDDDVTGPERRGQELLDVGAEDDPVDRPVDDARFGERIDPECCEECQRVPTAVRRIAFEASAFRSPASQRRHIRLDPCLIYKNETLRVEAATSAMPADATPDHVRPLLLTGEERFF